MATFSVCECVMEHEPFTVGCENCLEGGSLLLYSDSIDQGGDWVPGAPLPENRRPYDLEFVLAAPAGYVPEVRSTSTLFVDHADPLRDLPENCFQLIAPYGTLQGLFDVWAEQAMESVIDIVRFIGPVCTDFADLVSALNTSGGRAVTAAWVDCECTEQELLSQLGQLRLHPLLCHVIGGPELIHMSSFTRILNAVEAAFPRAEEVVLGYGVHPNKRTTLFLLGVPT